MQFSRTRVQSRPEKNPYDTVPYKGFEIFIQIRIFGIMVVLLKNVEELSSMSMRERAIAWGN